MVLGSSVTWNTMNVNSTVCALIRECVMHYKVGCQVNSIAIPPDYSGVYQFSHARLLFYSRWAAFSHIDRNHTYLASIALSTTIW